VLAQLGGSALLIDHVKGDGTEEGAENTRRPYGSVYKENLARSTFSVRKDDDTGIMTVVHRKVNRGAKLPPLGLHVDYGDGRITIGMADLTLNTSLARALPLADQIAALLADGALTDPQLAERMGKTRDQIAPTLYRHDRAAVGDDQQFAFEFTTAAT